MIVLGVLVAALNVAAVVSLEPVPFKLRDVSNATLYEGPELRIYGGTVAPESMFPFMIFAMMNLPQKGYVQCSASLVRPDWVLLAAHCVYKPGLKPKDVIVVGGRADLAAYVAKRLRVDFYAPIDEQVFGVQERRASMFVYHPNYDPTSLDHDVALIKVSEAFLPGTTETIPVSEDIIKSKKDCTILGWGLTPGNLQTYKLNYVVGKRVSTTKIGCMYKSSGRFICLEPHNTGICMGDSGSPLVCDGKVWGVASHLVSYSKNPDCGDSDEEYYTEIHAELDWLKSVYGSANLSSAISLRTVFVCVLAGLWLSSKT